MNQKWYRAGITKAALIIVAHIMVIVAAVSLMRIAVYPAIREEIFDGSLAEKYKDSKDFAARMKTYSARAVGEISAEQLYETDGEYDPDKLVDIESYYDTGMIGGKKRGKLVYRLEDILAWYESRNDEQSPAEQIVVCKEMDDSYRYYRISDFYELIKSGELQFIAVDEEQGPTEHTILSDLEYGNGMPEDVFRGIQDKDGRLLYSDCWLYDGKYFLEQYKPVEAASILEIANKEEEWNGKLNEMYMMLDVAIDGLGSMYDSYQSYRDELLEGDTNFSYIYVDVRNKHIYTNRKEYEAYGKAGESLEKMKKLGRYAVVMPKLADFDTNMELEAEDWRDVIKYTGPETEDFVFAAAVDTDYPIQDEFYRESSLYNKNSAGVRQAVSWCIGAAVLFVLCVMWLATVAGRRAGDEELHLNAFDRWKTEAAAVLIVLVWVLAMFVGFAGMEFMVPQSQIVEMSDEGLTQTYTFIPNMDSVLGIIWCSLMAGGTCSLFLIGFLSIVRRMKAKTIWENSILRWGCHFIEQVIKNLNGIWKIILLYSLFMLVQLMVYIATGGYFNKEIALLVFLGDIIVFIWLCYKAIGNYRIKKGIRHLAGGEVQYKISLDGLVGEQRETARMLNSISEGLDAALAENLKSERLKTDLITNVSHDIKTPLTSIINYVELLKQEKFEDPKLKRYIEVLEQKSQRLKTLTEDVVEASKVSSGNITLEFMDINFTEMLQQTSGEFEEKFKARDLQEILTLTSEGAVIRADGRRTWRVLENIYNNAAKYAMEGTRIYGDLTVSPYEVCFSLKNVSEQPLNISADELTERFIRGDISRSTEGSGLGLSIAKTLTEMQGGKFELYLDGDLFKVMISFPRV